MFNNEKEKMHFDVDKAYKTGYNNGDKKGG